MRLLSQVVTQCKLNTMAWFRQLLRKPHCFSAETLPVKYYLDRITAAADWRMLIYITFHEHERDSLTIHQMLLKPSLDIAGRCLWWNISVHQIEVTGHPGWGRPWTGRHQEYQVFKEWKQSLDLTNAVQDNQAMESFTHQVLYSLSTWKTGETTLCNGL